MRLKAKCFLAEGERESQLLFSLFRGVLCANWAFLIPKMHRTCIAPKMQRLIQIISPSLGQIFGLRQNGAAKIQKFTENEAKSGQLHNWKAHMHMEQQNRRDFIQETSQVCGEGREFTGIPLEDFRPRSREVWPKMVLLQSPRPNELCLDGSRASAPESSYWNETFAKGREDPPSEQSRSFAEVPAAKRKAEDVFLRECHPKTVGEPLIAKPLRGGPRAPDVEGLKRSWGRNCGLIL